MKPGLLVQKSAATHLVLDTKWKLLDDKRATGSDNYGLDKGDFYQFAYSTARSPSEPARPKPASQPEQVALR